MTAGYVALFLTLLLSAVGANAENEVLADLSATAVVLCVITTIVLLVT